MRFGGVGRPFGIEVVGEHVDDLRRDVLGLQRGQSTVDVRDDHTDDAVVGGLRDGDGNHVDVGFFQNVEDLLKTAFPVLKKDR